MASNIFRTIPYVGYGTWKPPVATVADLPVYGNDVGDIRVALDTGDVYEWDGTAWILIISPTASGITSLNGATDSAQFLLVGTAGTNFNIVTSTNNTNTFNIPYASATNTGLLLNTDWVTFNNKQPSGSYITALTGDATASGPGSATLTLSTVNSSPGTYTYATLTVNSKGLVTSASNGSTPLSPALPSGDIFVGNGSNIATATALSGDATLSNTGILTLDTVNSNVGTFGSSTSIPTFTVNSKGLITSASGNVVIAPAGTLTGTTLASNVISSSLTSVGTITSGIWNGTTIGIANGGTGQTTALAAFNALSPLTTAGDLLYYNGTNNTRLPIGTNGQVLTVVTGEPAWSTATGITTIGTIDSQTASSNGLVIVGNTLYAQSASTSNPGLVNNTTQSFSGNKTFTGTVDITASSLTAFEVGTNVLIVDTTNNAVGINTAPATNAILDIVNNSGSTKAIQLTGYGSNVGVRGRYANGTLSSPTAAVAGNTLEFISGRGWQDSVGFATASTGAINIVAGETFTTSSNATYLQFEVTATGSTTIAEAMRLNSTGNLLIGTTTDSGTQKLQVNGNSNVGTVTAGIWNGTVTAGTAFITSGTTYTTPANITTNTLFTFQLIGGGAGGSSSNSASTHSTSGGAGGGVLLFISGLSPSTAYTIAIGAGGAGGASGLVGSPGGITTLTIGATTYTAGGGSAAVAVTGVGGVGGTATNGTINVPGMNGGPSMSVFTSGGMPGGNSPFGFGMGGAGNAPSVAANGQNATGYGGGGGGSSSNGAPTGGNGTQGMILVKWNN